MITVKSSVEISGEHISLTVEGGQVKLLSIKSPPDFVTVGIPFVVKLITEMKDEFEQVLENLKGCADGSVKQLVFEPIDLQTVFKSIAASNSNEARHIAYQKFYANTENENTVLHVKTCPRIGDLPDGKREYDVLGFTRPRQKRLKGTLAPVEKKEEAPA